jgi:dTDP-4-dehydrorhamnose 3,5-epimerase
MKLFKTGISGCVYFNLKNYQDRRGFFSEIYRNKEYKRYIKQRFIQENYSSSKKNVFRGIHFQTKKPQGKLLTVLSGKIKDIIIDLRKKSPTFGKTISVNLSYNKFQQIWIPAGLGHGFFTLSNNTKIIYQCTEYYDPKNEKTLSYLDPKIIKFLPKSKYIISKKDSKGLLFNDLLKLY